MKAELTAEGILLVAQTPADELQLDALLERGGLNLACKSRQRATRKFGYKTKRGNLLLVAPAWDMRPLGKKHGTGDARRKRAA